MQFFDLDGHGPWTVYQGYTDPFTLYTDDTKALQIVSRYAEVFCLVIRSSILSRERRRPEGDNPEWEVVEKPGSRPVVEEEEEASQTTRDVVECLLLVPSERVDRAFERIGVATFLFTEERASFRDVERVGIQLV